MVHKGDLLRIKWPPAREKKNREEKRGYEKSMYDVKKMKIMRIKEGKKESQGGIWIAVGRRDACSVIIKYGTREKVCSVDFLAMDLIFPI